ncbi:11-beta-hydroxysteroid dehydrogenase-like 2 [Impatiens glandulifera]|uniref:11-beta-hydroxysteroid dehydrogenase-like 2 n=1 Tax=Impatiens glandulifera TaxID=253017 RepID=UPI001FB1440B|nr:11-beta-hydroxysteroid dehydrogenase-like 2 [Impatiens glandulifera]
MDLVQDLLNIVVPVVSIFIFAIFSPVILVYKLANKFLKRPFDQKTDLVGKVVLITGASSGIGEHLAYEYAKGRAELVLVARREDRLRLVAEKAMQLGSPNAIIVCGDVSNRRDCKHVVDKAMETFPRLDYVINNAGIAPISLFEDTIDDDVENHPIMNINFWGSVYITRFAIPYLRKSKGKIVVIASLAGCYPTPTLSIYTASKAAMIGFYEALRMEIGSEIGITIVAPGLVDSEITQSSQFNNKVKVGFVPLETTERCAKAIVRSAYRGERFLMEPSWIKWLYLWYLICPELIERASRRAILERQRALLEKESTHAKVK